MRPIDGDKLLEAIEEERKYLRSRGLYGAEHILVHNFRNLVEDAQTISLPNEQIAWEQGYECGKNEERPQGECKTCRHRDPEDKKCDCGGLERQGCPFPVSDDYYCKYYERGGAE